MPEQLETKPLLGRKVLEELLDPIQGRKVLNFGSQDGELTFYTMLWEAPGGTVHLSNIQTKQRVRTC